MIRPQNTEGACVSRSAQSLAEPSLDQNQISKSSRRGILGGLAAALGFGAVANVGAAVHRVTGAAAPSIAPSAPIKRNDDLAGLRDRSGAVQSEFLAAREAKGEARFWAEKLCPAVPEVLNRRWDDPQALKNCTVELRDVEDSHLPMSYVVKADGRRYAQMPPKIFHSKPMRAVLQEMAARPPVWPSGSDTRRRLRRLIPIAEKYERSRRNALSVAGLDKATARLDAAQWEIALLAMAAAELDPRTIEGVTILAQIALLPIQLDASTPLQHHVRLILSEPIAKAVMHLSHPGEVVA